MTGDPGFTTPEMSEIFSVESRVASMCRFEAELARAQADLGIVPEDAAEAIAAACAAPLDDPAAILRTGWERGTPVIELLEQLRARLPAEQAAWIHHGATTQDVVDTALMLQARAGLGVVGGSLARLAEGLAGIADSHRNTPVMGRTFLQEAVPMSFGARVANWLRPLLELVVDIGEAANRLPVQLGGPVGDMTSFGAPAFEISDRLADRLELVAPVAPWHTDRTPMTDVAALMGRAATAAAKIATDITLLSAAGEVRVRSGGSSSMPHKENPVDALRAAAAARVCLAAVAGLVSGPSHQLERSAGAWHAESALVPLVFEAGAAAVAAVGRAVETLEVDVDSLSERTPADLSDVGLIDRVLEAHRRVAGP